jgi:hypothetical protein
MPKSSLKFPLWVASSGFAPQRANDFMEDLAGRLAERVQLTTDGLKVYPDAVEAAFKGNVDYGMLNKSYGNEAGLKEAKRRYSPATMTSCEKLRVYGNPDKDQISTSHVAGKPVYAYGDAQVYPADQRI